MTYHIRKSFFALTLSVMGLCVKAQTITVEEARQNVLDFLSLADTSLAVKSCSSHAQGRELQLVYTASDSNGNPDLYVFNHTYGGFVVAGGDEAAKAVLAYSDEGTFHAPTLPDNFRYWLSACQRQIESQKLHRTKAQTVRSTGSRTDIDPLIKTHWSQEAPFNSQCPTDLGKAAMAGCVATAMAQVMKYHQWPATGTGSHTYYDTVSKQQLTSDFSAHTYDWPNMQNKYTKSSTQSQQAAVASLMYDCGISVEMQYSTDGSGAWTENIPYAIVRYFGYDQGTSQIMHDYVSDEEWEDYIYNELAHGRPVIFSGADETGDTGHCFVCDGYKKTTDKYHFNWGWGGMSDCYCSLSAVEGSGIDFNYMQDIVIGIQPPAEETTLPLSIYAYDGDIKVTKTTTDGYDTYTIKYQTVELLDTVNNQIYNHTYRDLDVLFAMKYTNMTTGKSYVTQSSQYTFPSIYPLDDDYTLHGITQVIIKSTPLSDMPAGTYRLTLVAKDPLANDNGNDTIWQEVRTYKKCKNYITINHVPTNVSTPTTPQTRLELAEGTYTLAGQLVMNESKGRTSTKPGYIYIKGGKKYRQK